MSMCADLGRYEYEEEKYIVHTRYYCCSAFRMSHNLLRNPRNMVLKV